MDAPAYRVYRAGPASTSTARSPDTSSTSTAKPSLRRRNSSEDAGRRRREGAELYALDERRQHGSLDAESALECGGHKAQNRLKQIRRAPAAHACGWHATG